MFRYYSWLPTEIEPEYKDGFTCDKCARDYLSGPFYHQEETGEDYCTTCGEAEGLTRFNGLICSLLFSDTGEVLRDAQTGTFAVFAYKVHSGRVGVYFSDGATLLLHLSPRSTTSSIVSVACRHPESPRQEQLLEPLEWRERFPWLAARGPVEHFPVAVELHDALPESSVTVADNVFIVKHEESESGFLLELEGGWQQVFDSVGGIELVAKNGIVVSLFEARAGSTHVWTKSEAQQFHDEMKKTLRDKL